MQSTSAVADTFRPPADIIIVATPFVSGHHVTRVIGATFGLIARSRGFGQNISAYFRAWGGGEIKLYTNLLERARHRAPMRLSESAKSFGAEVMLSCHAQTVLRGNDAAETVRKVRRRGSSSPR